MGLENAGRADVRGPEPRTALKRRSPIIRAVVVFLQIGDGNIKLNQWPNLARCLASRETRLRSLSFSALTSRRPSMIILGLQRLHCGSAAALAVVVPGLDTLCKYAVMFSSGA